MKLKLAGRIYLGFVLTVISLCFWRFLLVPLGDTITDSGYYREDRAHHRPHGWTSRLETDRQKHLPPGTTYRLWEKHLLALRSQQAKRPAPPSSGR